MNLSSPRVLADICKPQWPFLSLPGHQRGRSIHSSQDSNGQKQYTPSWRSCRSQENRLKLNPKPFPNHPLSTRKFSSNGRNQDSNNNIEVDNEPWSKIAGFFPFWMQVDQSGRELNPDLILIDKKTHFFCQKEKAMAVLAWVSNGGGLGRSYGRAALLLLGLGYYTQGFRCFPWLAVFFFFKDVLKADPVTLQLVQATVNLPMVAKPVYGIISDAVFVRGAHRVPYLILGCSLQTLSWAAIVFLPSASSSVSVFGFFLGLSNLGASITEVMNDALVAECSNKRSRRGGRDREGAGGELQSFAWLTSAAGGVLGNSLGALALNRSTDFKSMFGIFTVLVAAQGLVCARVSESSLVNSPAPPPLYPTKTCHKRLKDPLDATTFTLEMISDEYWYPDHLTMGESPKRGGIRGQVLDLIVLVKKPDLLYPMAWFVASYAMIPTLNATMFFYQTQHLKVDPTIIGLSKVVGQVGLMTGSMVYSRFLKSVSLRKLVGSTQILLSLCMLSDIILVKGINIQMGIPNEVMVLGLSSFIDAIGQFKLLPFMVLLAQLCPSGSEGSLLAFFMSVQCLATIVSGYLGVTLASILHISTDNFDDLALGISIEALATLLPLIWISFLPESSKQERD